MFNRIREWVRAWVGPNVSISNPDAYNVFAGVRSSSGVPVTRDTVFALPAFIAGVDLIASSIGKIDSPVYKWDKSGSKVKDADHAAYRLLMRRPNAWQTPFEFRRQLAANAIWAGNGYAFVNRDPRTADPTDLVILDSNHTYPIITRSVTDPADVNVTYITEIEGREIAIPFGDMIHVRGLGNNLGYLGMRLIDVVKESLGLGIAVIRYGSIYFQHGCAPSTIVEFPEWVAPEKVKEFRETFNAHHESLNNAHKLGILQGGAKLVNNSVSNEDAQFLASRKMTLIDVALILGLPPSFVGAMDASTSYGSLEQDNLNLLTHSLDKWFRNLEQHFESKLLRESEKIRDSRFIRFDRSQLLQADHATTVTTMVALVNNGLMLPNDANVVLNLPPVEDDFNKLRLPSGVTVQGEEPETVSEPQLDQQEDDGGAEQAEDDEQDADEQDDNSRARLEKLTASVLTRFLTRLHKAADAASKRDDWQAWLQDGLDEHRGVLTDTLEPVADDAGAEADALLDELRGELRAVTRDQLDAVFDRVQVGDWTRRILDA